MIAAKAYTAAAIAFLGLVATRKIELVWYVEGLLLASIAAVSVYIVPNKT